MRVAGNRGASGIDGVVSTAAGFAAGLQRPVTLLIGDVSFMHDSNALLLLREQNSIPPLCVVVVNNQGGGIFNFLPVASMLRESTFKPLFSTPPGVDMSLLCKAHRVPHLTATTPSELHAALAQGWGMRRHCVVEVFTDPTRNTTHHQQLSSSARTAAQRALQVCVNIRTFAARSVQFLISLVEFTIREPKNQSYLCEKRSGKIILGRIQQRSGKLAAEEGVAGLKTIPSAGDEDAAARRLRRLLPTVLHVIVLLRTVVAGRRHRTSGVVPALLAAHAAQGDHHPLGG